ncbi:MAG: hypothetical protein HZB66_02130 [Candidatus Aenigmarchaeota archaeon]|nr:hypothetical protein [Candidatus Aenigmarchaeota archaeon]
MYLVRYGEVFLKSEPVMRQFLDRLVSNLYPRLRGVKIRKVSGRIVIETEKDISSVLEHTFGIVSFSGCIACEKKMETIEETVKNTAREFRKGKTFAIISSRSDKSFAFSSKQINEKIGAAVCGMGFKVNLSKPDRKIYIEVRDMCYIYTEIVKGPGGLPYGTAGKVLAEIKNANDVRAALMMMKRGAEIIPLLGSRHIEELNKWSPFPIKAMKLEEAVKERPMAFVSGKTDKEIISDIRKGKLEKNRHMVPVFYPLAGE